MNGCEGNSQVTRARPLSAGLWTLFSWLRREDYGSTDSLSSVGSDRTAASFAFVPHTPRRHVQLPSVTPPSPRTDSYRKRVHDRSLRRVYDRELTLHRKYGLYQGEANTLTLPFSRREASVTKDCSEQRERRATSEGYRRRSAHVPGKRRAPPPPSTLPKARSRRTRKRRAPLPPDNLVSPAQKNVNTNNKLRMNCNPNLEDEFSLSTAGTSGCKSEKYVKKDEDTKPKLWSEKSFLKGIFENKKRNSSTDTVPNKILPSISELDKEAAEIMKTSEYKALRKANDQINNKKEKWLCTNCLRILNSTVLICPYCQSENKNLSRGFHKNQKASNIYTQTETDTVPTKASNIGEEDKQKLKEMLKKMKDSIPKKRKQENSSETDQNIDDSRIVEAPTLRIGTNGNDTYSKPTISSDQPAKYKNENDGACYSDENEKHDFTSVVVTQPVILVAPYCEQKNQRKDVRSKIPQEVIKSDNGEAIINNNFRATPLSSDNIENKRIHTPLRISTLLNPEPENTATKFFGSMSSKPNSETTNTPSVYLNKVCVKELNCSKELKNEKRTSPNCPSKKPQEINVEIKPSTSSGGSLLISEVTTGKVGNHNNISSQILSQYAQRRSLINQLEQSIAKGDEKAAADAAAKLAQLRLSCSVLSFSSKIAGSTSAENKMTEIKNIINTSGESYVKNDGVSAISNNINQPKNKINEEVKCYIQPKGVLNIKKTTASQTVKNIKINEDAMKKSIEEAGLSKCNDKTENENGSALIEVWVEDREGTRGPIQLKMSKNATVGHLKRQVENDLKLAARLQRWIVGRTLCSDDTMPLKTLAGPHLNVPFYLCIVESGVMLINCENEVEDKVDATKPENAKTDIYSELVKLEQQAFILNTETFECDICMEVCAPARGVVLRDCVHSFCKECLSQLIRQSADPVVSCPALGCSGILQEREIRALVSQEDYNTWLARGLTAAESGSRNAFHCRTRDCTGWALCETGVTKFPCPVCKHTNCIPCQAIHENETCSQYRMKLEKAEALANVHEIDESTRALLDALLEKGEALKCPECEAIITKKWGCDWVKCSACKTEICWITRGRRWGPNGRGDTTGGCRCGIDGKRCHPSCGYCH